MAKTITINGKQLSVGDKAFFVYDESRKNPDDAPGYEVTIDKIGTKLLYIEGAFDPVYIDTHETKDSYECQYGTGVLYADLAHYEEAKLTEQKCKELAEVIRKNIGGKISLDKLKRIAAIIHE